MAYPKPKIYRPLNPDKYRGTLPIVIRSKIEEKFAKLCDINKDVLLWASESVEIEYLSPLDNRIHRYFPDFLIQFQTKEGEVFWLVEIKQSIDLVKPKRQKSGSQKAFISEAKKYIVNRAKWDAAEEWCRRNGSFDGRPIIFKVITERALGRGIR